MRSPRRKRSAKFSSTEEPRSSVSTVTTLDCPAELSPLARQEWDRLVEDLTARDCLTKVDLGPLAIYCAAYAHWAEAEEAIQKYGAVMKSPSGYPVQSPYVAIANRQIEVMMRIACEFGFTPASRNRIGNPSKGGPALLDMNGFEISDGTW